MNIRFTQPYSCPAGHYAAGKTYDLPDDVAGVLIDVEIATAVEPAPASADKGDKKKTSRRT